MRLIKLELDMEAREILTVYSGTCWDRGKALFVHDEKGKHKFEGMKGRNIRWKTLEHVASHRPDRASIYYVDNGEGRVTQTEAYAMHAMRLLDFVRDNQQRWAVRMEHLEEELWAIRTGE